MVICYINPEKLKIFKPKRNELETIHVNLLSQKGARQAINNINRMFSKTNRNVKICYWIGGSPFTKGELYAEFNVSLDGIEFLGMEQK